MKSLAVALLIALAALGGAAVADAQTGAAPAPSATPSAPSGDVKSPADTPSQPSARSDDGGSALPRAATGERTTIFGLSPTAAVIIAAALLVVVILAIIAMTRSDDTYMER
jgi:hypothetical protein